MIREIFYVVCALNEQKNKLFLKFVLYHPVEFRRQNYVVSEISYTVLPINLKHRVVNKDWFILIQ